MEQGFIQLARGKKVIPSELTGITTTKTSIGYNTKGHNAITLFVDFTVVAGSYTVKLQAKAPNGTYMDLYDNSGALMAITCSADKAQSFVGITSDFRIVSTEDVDGGTLTIMFELFSV